MWLDGTQLGGTIGYFVPHRFEITKALQRRDQHALAVEVACDSGRNSADLTGSLQSGPFSPTPQPGGLWRPIRITETGPVAIKWSRLICTRADADQAELKIRLVLDASTAGDYQVDTTITGPDGEATTGLQNQHTLAAGENRIEWTVSIDAPALWWPRSLGSQPLYEVGVVVRDDAQEASDRSHWRAGLRTVDCQRLIWKINDTRLFLKGINLGPQSGHLADLDANAVAEDVRTAAEAGFDLMRVHGHVARPELYSAADELGMLLWQDLPLAGTYSTRIRSNARFLARGITDVLGHHPSIITWGVHEAPNGSAFPPPEAEGSRPGRLRRLGRHLSPSWNRSVLDPMLRRELRQADPSRPTMSRSGSLPLLHDPASSDSHLWLGWHTAVHEDLDEVLRQWPRLGAFAGGIGSQSVPAADWGPDEPTWRTAERGAFARYLPRRAYADGHTWARATQAYQAELLRSHIETLRRVKYRPAGGFVLSALADAEESGGFGILFHDRARKPAFDAVVDSCRPVIVVATRPPSVTTAGERLHVDIHAINDRHEPVSDARISAEARCGDWSLSKHWDGTLDADSCELVGTLSFTVPDLHGALIIDLQLVAADSAVTNRYSTVVIPPSEAVDRPATARRS